MKSKLLEKSCETCSIKILVRIYPSDKKYKSHKNKGRFCSLSCMAKWNWAGTRNPKYDSKRFGEKNPNWVDGRTPWRKRVYNSPAWKEWRQFLFERDDYTCQICGTRGSQNLQANHIKRFIDCPELRFDTKNGITLCEWCHRKRVNNHEAEWASYFNFNLATRGIIEDEFISLNL